jgi:DNA primase
MIEVGLLRSGNGYHDAFKNRIMFPIKDLDGNVVGFSGRKFLPNTENESKYINTNETVVFKKGEILYNYSDCITDIKLNKNVYLFEGFMDVIAAVKSNIKNSVASMGTALTSNQINALKRITNNVTLCFDSDGPGVQATIKAIHLLTNAEINVNVVVIPDGKDADEYLFNNGSEKLHSVLVNDIISAMEFLYKYERSVRK